MIKSRALILGVTSALVVLTGAIMGVLLHQLYVTTLEGATSNLDSKYASIKSVEAGPIWVVGLVYVFPGMLCFIAAFLQNKCFYITSCIFAMISIVIMGLICVFIGFPMFVMLALFNDLTKDCNDDTINDVCKCRAGTSEYQEMPFKECSFLSEFVGYGIGLGVSMTIAWILLVAAFVIAFVFACRSKTTSGTVFTPAQQPMLQG